MRGLSTRNYGAVVKEFSNAYGIEKSAVSENFVEASREKVKQLMERPLGEVALVRGCLIDGTRIQAPSHDCGVGHRLRRAQDGIGAARGAQLRMRQWSVSCSAIYSNEGWTSRRRGYTFSTAGKALHTAVRRHAGESGFIQRCQVHKKRNVLDHLPDEHKAGVGREAAERLRNARVRTGASRADAVAPRVDGLEPERGAKLWRKGWRRRSPSTNWACLTCSASAGNGEGVQPLR